VESIKCYKFALIKKKTIFVKNIYNMLASVSAQDQIAALIAEAMPEKIISFKFDTSIQKRISDLVYCKKDGLISMEEKEELEKYLAYDLLIGLAKARAVQYVKPL
jgi:hypothetical protein